jgi:ATP-binding cassette subfamily F protein 3
LEKLPPLIAPGLDEMEGLGQSGADATTYFSFPDPEVISGTMLQMTDVTFAYTPTTPVILEKVSFDVSLDSKVAIVGPNGAGE